MRKIYDKIDTRIEETFESGWDCDTIVDIDDISEFKGWLLIVITIVYKDSKPRIRKSYLIRKDEYERNEMSHFIPLKKIGLIQ